MQGGGNSRWRAGNGAGGGGGGGRPGAGSTPAMGPPRTLAQRQVRHQQEIQRAQQQRAEAKRREDLLAQENARLRRQVAAQASRQGDGDMELGDDMEEEDEHDLSEDERKKRIDETTSGLAYLATNFGEDSCELLGKRLELAALG